MRVKYLLLTFCVLLVYEEISAIDNVNIISNVLSDERFTLLKEGIPTPILFDEGDDFGVLDAIKNLRGDFMRVCGDSSQVLNVPSGKQIIIIGSYDSRYVSKLVKSGKLDISTLVGKTEQYIITTVLAPLPGVDEALLITGSDKRGVVYGIYELSEQIGVSPWYDWADAPVEPQTNLSLERGTYTSGEPAVRYRGIFLNDEAPCLTGWVKNTYGTNYGDHRFYARVFELILRLRGNLLWPAMWNWSFYADDVRNSVMADRMGVIMGTSHHEPMARNHQEWARNRNKYGVWDYESNQQTIDKFFREGIERVKDTEDLITIGMRGDGDAAMGGDEGGTDVDQHNIDLLRKIVANQRAIIEDVTGCSANKRTQVWAIYKEVQRYYDKGLRVPDDVIMLLCDDNWGNVRYLPSISDDLQHPGGYGMYYHIDYVGAPRNSKWLNCTQIQHMWEQLQLSYDYGVEKLWILNVGDLKPMEYPITFFLDMAWNPKRFTAENLFDHTRLFCARLFGEKFSNEAARILNMQYKYAGRCTPELLDRNTYNLESGEWKQVVDEYRILESDALRQYVSLPLVARDAYKQLILFPVQAMSNLYEMYYSQAMNHSLYREGRTEANEWAERVKQAFARDSVLCHDYNCFMSGGKWNGMMKQKHIGYTSWNDQFPFDKLPEIYYVDLSKKCGGCVFTYKDGVISIESGHFYAADNTPKATWQEIPYLGRTLSGVSLMPYTEDPLGASLRYRMTLPDGLDKVQIHVVLKSTLAFHDKGGHEFSIGFLGGKSTICNINKDLNEDSKNIYSVFYPTVARRIIECVVLIEVPKNPIEGNIYELAVSPKDPGIVFEKFVIDLGGYCKTYLYMDESPWHYE